MEEKTMKKNYKDFEKIFIGESDIAQLTLRYFNDDAKEVELDILHFGEDGAYNAYLIQDEEVEIPNHYQLVFDKQISWMDIIDDTGIIAFDCPANIKIYRAGNYGCIICLKYLK